MGGGHDDEGEGGGGEVRFRGALAALLPDLRAFARFLARDPAAADDLVQEALLRALRAEAQWRPGTSLRAWAFGILRNAFYEGRRRAGVERRVLDAVGNGATEATPARQDGRAEVSRLGDALARLAAPQREALVLVAVMGFTHEEAAGVSGVAVGTLKARVSRARRALAEMAWPTTHE